MKALYSTGVVHLDRKESIFEAARLMRSQHVGDIVVTERRAGRTVPCGILTDRDIVVEVVADELPMSGLTVEDVMCRDLVLASSHASLDELIHLMRQHGVRRIPVVDSDGNLAGIVSADDLMERVGQEVSQLAKIPRKQRKIERELLAAQR